VGLSKKVYNLDNLIFQTVFDHIGSCSCENGCPSCIGPPLEAGLYGKASAQKILKALL
jgi:DEAD/DEAH box helicase domain-containing protein